MASFQAPARPLSVFDIIAQLVAKPGPGPLAPHIMAPNQYDAWVRPEAKPVDPNPPAIHPSFIHVAKPFVFEQIIQDCIEAMGANRTREEALRLQGVTWIDNVRKALKLPVRTYNTAVVYYHRFRLVHPDTEYNYVDAAAAALFTACKTEDTLKKSRDIVCAAYNLKLNPSEYLAPDNALFEAQARGVIGLERLMLESSGFDFRTRHPQKALVKLARVYKVERDEPLARLAYNISLDLYRTYAPLKSTTQTLATACLELAGRLLGQNIKALEDGEHYAKWHTSRGEVMETLLDLLELYTHSRASTSVGPHFPVDRFLKVRIPLNQEMSARQILRFTGPTRAANNPEQDGASDRPHHPLTPVAATGERRGASEHGRDAAQRFMLDPACAEEERRLVEEYFVVEWEDYEEE